MQHLDPALNVRRIIAEAAWRFYAAVADEGSGSDFSDQFFFAVCIRAKEGGFLKTIQTAAVSRAVRQFMEGCAVVFSCAFKLREQGECDAVRGRLIECAIAFPMNEVNAAALDVCGYDLLGSFNRVCMLLEVLGVLGFDTLALVDIFAITLRIMS